MYYSYVEIEYVATSFSPARMDLALKLLTPYPSLSPYSQTDDGQRNEYIRCAWAGGTFFPVVLLCASFLVLAGNRFWCYLHT